MSKFSGKCDFYDSAIMIHQYTEEEFKNNVIIYVGNNPEPLKINSMKDLIPYYPYLVSMAAYNNVERKSVIHLCSESFVDQEEREILTWKLEHLIKIYNRCKRKKVEFDIDAAVKEVCCFGVDDYVRELAERVKEKGKKATIDGIHMPMRDYYRKELVEEMLENGLDPAEWGYGRFVGEKKNELD